MSLPKSWEEPGSSASLSRTGSSTSVLKMYTPMEPETIFGLYGERTLVVAGFSSKPVVRLERGISSTPKRLHSLGSLRMVARVTAAPAAGGGASIRSEFLLVIWWPERTSNGLGSH